MKLYKYVSESRYEPVIEIPDNPTNGEVMQKMFPELKVRYIDEWDDGNSKLLYRRAFVNVDFGHGEMLGFSLEWWNRKRGE